MEKYKNIVKTHVTTLVETIALLALTASGLAVMAVLAGYTNFLNNATARVGLEWLVVVDLAYVFGSVYRLILSKKTK